MNNTILIVDDIMLNVDMLTTILSPKYKIMAAISGESAIKLLERKKPDLVLLDLSMPGIDGFGVLKHMKSQEELAGIPVIFVTGEHGSDAEEKALALGAVDYIKKPYNIAVILTKVKNHLELKAYRDNLEALVYERTRELEEQTKRLEERTKQLASAHEAIIMGMSYMSESHDKVTGTHIERIKSLTALLTDKIMELYPDLISKDLAHQIVMYSPLHDVGKVSIPDSILKKEGPLTEDEFEIMKEHTLKSTDLLRKTEQFYDQEEEAQLKVAIEIAESHHEKYNGEGYPHGLKGEFIPFSARIVTLADIYDALRSERPYKRSYSHEEAVAIILRGDGRTKPEHFDAKVLEAFSAVSDEFSKLYDSQ